MSFAEYFSYNYMTLMTLSGLVLLMFVNRNAKIPASSCFRAGIILLLAITVSDYIGNYYKFLTVTDPDMTPFAIERRYIWDTISYIIRPVIILIEVLVILPDKKYKYLCILPVVVNGIIYSTRFFGSDLTFGLGEDNIFHEGPLHITVFVVQLIYLLLLLIFSLISFKQNVRQSIMIFGILAQAVIAALGEYVFQYDYDLSAQVTAFCILEYYMYLTAVYQREIRETALEKERDSARNELLVLKNQIHPHFIYNTLSIIRSLINTDKTKAADCLDDFTQYIRTHISALKKASLIPFEDELENAKLYLSLVQVDYEDRLKMEYDIGVTEFLIPPLTLEPLVENAVKHGIGWGGGAITVRTFTDGERIVVQINDDGSKSADEDAEFELPHNGIGIENTRKRLQLQCGGTLEIEITDHGTTAEIGLPRKVCEINEYTYS